MAPCYLLKGAHNFPASTKRKKRKQLLRKIQSKYPNCPLSLSHSITDLLYINFPSILSYFSLQESVLSSTLIALEMKKLL